LLLPTSRRLSAHADIANRAAQHEVVPIEKLAEFERLTGMDLLNTIGLKAQS
jgi:hypothetical protein